MAETLYGLTQDQIDLILEALRKQPEIEAQIAQLRAQSQESKDYFWAKRMQQGPEGESDYSDNERLWFQKVYISNDDDEPTSKIEVTEIDTDDPAFIYGTATRMTANPLPEVNSLIQVYFLRSGDSPTVGRYGFIG